MNKSNRVLVVEDDAAIVRALSSFLTDEGFLCKSANGQAEALRLFEQEEFDIVLLDVSLESGFQTPRCWAFPDMRSIPSPRLHTRLLLLPHFRKVDAFPNLSASRHTKRVVP